MEFEQYAGRYIDRLCKTLVFEIERFCNCHRKEVQASAAIDLNKEHNTFRISLREKMLEKAILEAISKLEETKRSFKSRKIKEVREKLIEVITGQGRFTSQHKAEE